MTKRKIQAPALYRECELDATRIDEENRTVSVTFSTETPVRRWFGDEILDHGKSSVDLKRLRSVGSVLLNHDPNRAVGSPLNVRIEDREGRAEIRFGTKALAEEAFLDVREGVVRGVSVGYAIREMKLEKKTDGAPSTYRVTRWEPIEFSLTPVPADPSAKAGREVGLDELVELAKREGRELFECEVEDEEDTPAGREAAPGEETRMKKCGRCGRELAEGAACDCGTAEAATAATAAERQRVQTILQLSETHRMGELGRQFVESGKSVEEFRAAILEKYGATLASIGEIRQVAERQTHDDVGLSAREAKRFSLFRLARARIPGASRADVEAAAFELEACAAQAKRVGRDPQGVFLPNEVAFGRRSADGTRTGGIVRGQRDLDKATEGADLVQTDVAGNVIELLRNKTTATSLSTILTGLKGNVKLPRLSGGASGAFVTEGNSSEQTQTLDSIDLDPKSATAFTDITRKLLIQSSPDVEALVRDDLNRAIGLTIDNALLNGSGIGANPLGLFEYPGIGSVTAAGTLSWAETVELWSDVAGANADMGNLAFITSSRIAAVLLTTVKVGTFPVFIMSDDFKILGFPVYVSNQVPSAGGAGKIAFGNWSDAVVGLWDALDVLFDPFTLGHEAKVRIRVIMEADVDFRHVGSFSVVEDIT